MINISPSVFLDVSNYESVTHCEVLGVNPSPYTVDVIHGDRRTYRSSDYLILKINFVNPPRTWQQDISCMLVEDYELEEIVKGDTCMSKQLGYEIEVFFVMQKP